MRSKTTTFASAATPIVRISPGEARQRQRDVEEQDRRVHERGVDAEADHRDEAEEAVEEQQEEHDGDQAADRCVLRLLQRVLTERRRDVGALERDEVDRQGAGLQHEREVLRLADAADVVDLGAGAGRVDAVRVLRSGRSPATSAAGCRARSRTRSRRCSSRLRC